MVSDRIVATTKTTDIAAAQRVEGSSSAPGVGVGISGSPGRPAQDAPDDDAERHVQHPQAGRWGGRRSTMWAGGGRVWSLRRCEDGNGSAAPPPLMPTAASYNNGEYDDEYNNNEDE